MPHLNLRLRGGLLRKLRFPPPVRTYHVPQVASVRLELGDTSLCALKCFLQSFYLCRGLFRPAPSTPGTPLS